MTRDRTAEATRQLDLLVQRLRDLGPARLGRVGDSGRTPAQAAHDLAQRLADDRADLVGEQRRPVPRLDDHAVGDQVAVVGRELLATLTEIADRQAAVRVEAAARRAIERLRATLP
jgi:hypothetical protein